MRITIDKDEVYADVEIPAGWRPVYRGKIRKEDQVWRPKTVIAGEFHPAILDNPARPVSHYYLVIRKIA